MDADEAAAKVQLSLQPTPDDLVRVVLEDIAATGHLPEGLIEEAGSLVDEKRIMLMRGSPSGRSVFLVRCAVPREGGTETHIKLCTAEMCTCSTWAHQMSDPRHTRMCSHMLGCQLAWALFRGNAGDGRIGEDATGSGVPLLREKEVPDAEIADIWAKFAGEHPGSSIDL